MHKALNSRFSIIQGPPGTGKTNTILNIIANLILHKKSVLIVSGNNSATNNILKKLEQNGFGFIAAPLGNLENKDRFIENNPIPIPDMTLWSQDSNGAQEMLNSSYQDLDRIFELREDIAGYKHELAECQLEQKHFEQELLGNKFYPADSSTTMPSKRIQSRIHILQHLASLIYNDGKPNIYDFKRALQQSFRTLQYRWLFDLRGKITIKSIEELIQNHNRIFYINRERELNDLISYTEDILTNLNAEKINADATSASLKIFKAFLASNYSYERQKYTDIFSNGKNFIKDYPIVLSTTFSACRCFKKDTQFDYIIMDEASQVSIESAIPALTCAHNAVIVGDTKQLPNIRKNKEKNKLLELEAKLKIPSGYSCANLSFLSSVLETLPDAPVTLLREHYRCHPDIINFCNRKFYDGKLLIMTERKSNERALSMITTSKGNHTRHHENQREIDVIEEEISNSLKEKDDIGLIAPYKDQVKLMGKDLTLLKNNDDNKASTVHAFQGQEKKTIILSVTDDYITEFSDNPNLINVALSRAIEKFHLVVSGNEQKLHGNIYDLMNYIRYNNGEVRESALNSIFDNLHRYSSQNYAPGQTESSPAEDLTSKLINELLRTEFKGANLNYLRHYPLGALIAENGKPDTGSKTALSQELKDYVKASGTHLDFLIYNELTKNAVLAVEVDGVSYHKEGTKQYERDEKKNKVLKICKLPLLRLKTTEHSESERLIKMINDAIGRKDYGQNNPHLHQVNNPQDSNTSSQS